MYGAQSFENDSARRRPDRKTGVAASATDTRV